MTGINRTRFSKLYAKSLVNLRPKKPSQSPPAGSKSELGVCTDKKDGIQPSSAVLPAAGGLGRVAGDILAVNNSPAGWGHSAAASFGDIAAVAVVAVAAAVAGEGEGEGEGRGHSASQLEERPHVLAPSPLEHFVASKTRGLVLRSLGNRAAVRVDTGRSGLVRRPPLGAGAGMSAPRLHLPTMGESRSLVDGSGVGVW